jgi:tRNA threonylcarbamoyl adenosine modification protein YjeE
MTPVSFLLPTPEATSALAAAMAPLLMPGDVLLLEGPIGAGKSHFARALIMTRLAAAGRQEDIPSPSFTLVQSYDDGQTEIWHADLYRLADSGEVEELGLTQAFGEAICLVEWPDRLGDLAPEGSLRLTFAPTEDAEARQLTCTSQDRRWDGPLAAAREAAHV